LKDGLTALSVCERRRPMRHHEDADKPAGEAPGLRVIRITARPMPVLIRAY
jgi:hypothetical protein